MSLGRRRREPDTQPIYPSKVDKPKRLTPAPACAARRCYWRGSHLAYGLAGHRARRGSKGFVLLEVAVPSLLSASLRCRERLLMGVIIGMDQHKRSATIKVIDDRAKVLASGRYGTDGTG